MANELTGGWPTFSKGIMILEERIAPPRLKTWATHARREQGPQCSRGERWIEALTPTHSEGESHARQATLV
jgi:hypothetical protein